MNAKERRVKRALRLVLSVGMFLAAVFLVYAAPVLWRSTVSKLSVIPQIPHASAAACNTMTVGATGTQVSTLAITSTDQYTGAAFTLLCNNGTSKSATSIAITASSTATGIASIKLYTDTATNCSTANPAATGTLFGSSSSPSANKFTITGSVSVGQTKVCVYVLASTNSSASENQAFDISIAAATDVVSTVTETCSPSCPLNITGVTTLKRTLTIGTSGTQNAALTIPSTNQFVGGAFTLTSSDTQTVSSIAVTVNSATGLSNMKLYTDTAASCNTADPVNNATQLGTTQAAVSTKTTFGSLSQSVGTTARCIYVVVDVGTGAADGQSLDVSIAASGDVAVTGGLVTGTAAIAGATTLNRFLTVDSTGTQTANLYTGTTNQFIGGAFTLSRSDSTANVTTIKVTLSGTGLAAADIANMRLHTDTAASCSTSSFTAGVNQYGSTIASPVVGSNTFSGTVSVGTGTTCVYVVMNIASGATPGDTLDISINASTDVTVSAGTISGSFPVAVSGSGTIATPGNTFSGSIFNSDETNTSTLATTVMLALGNTASYSTTSLGDGSFSFTNITATSTGAVFTMWISNGGTNHGAIVFTYSSTNCNGSGGANCTNLKLYQDHVSVRSFDGSTISNTTLASCDNDTGTKCSDSNIGFTSNGGILTLTWATNRLRVGTSTTFAPGGNVNAEKLHVVGTYTGGGETLSLSGSGTGSSRPLVVDGTFTPSTGTVEFTGTGASDISAVGDKVTYNNLALDPASGSPTYNLATSTGATLTINGNFTVGTTSGASVLVAANTYSPTINLLGNFILQSGSTYSGGGTLVFKKGGVQNITDNTASGQDLGSVQISATTTNTTLYPLTNVKLGALTLDSSQIFMDNGKTITLLGDLTNNGSLTATGTMAVDFSVNPTINIKGSSNTNFYNFTINYQPGSTITFKSGNTYGFTSSLTMLGTSGSPLNVKASTAGSQWLIGSVGSYSLSYLNFTDTGCSGSAPGISVGVTVTSGGGNGSCLMFVAWGGNGNGPGGSGGIGGPSPADNVTGGGNPTGGGTNQGGGVTNNGGGNPTGGGTNQGGGGGSGGSSGTP